MKEERSSGLPTALLRYLADSDLHVLSWNGPAGVLLVRVVKDIGPETGVVKFNGVSHVNLPPQLGISGIECGSLNSLPTNFLGTYRQNDQSLEGEEVAYLIHGSWGEEFFVIATEVEYNIDP
jgi:hypothetical protein